MQVTSEPNNLDGDAEAQAGLRAEKRSDAGLVRGDRIQIAHGAAY
jgi:hypothetical protein